MREEDGEDSESVSTTLHMIRRNEVNQLENIHYQHIGYLPSGAILVALTPLSRLLVTLRVRDTRFTRDDLSEVGETSFLQACGVIGGPRNQ